ncbi:hypothetical protein DYB31_011874 [Aphanomyces astaci]|uniref:START domain-containing protein n=1 Tax=Aphanomyces astaci TaxID=112090 RepID=A0A397EE26_APHAT|nr:hypothetical protein DYB31_011874 [Aphanomyces astaci]
MGSRGDSSHAISSTSGMSLDEQEPRLRLQCQSLLKSALATPINIATDSGWTLKHEKQVYCKSLQDKELDKYVCTGTLNTSLPCLAWGLYAATTDDLRISASILYESEFMDAKVVRVFEAASADDSFKFSGVKYIKTQMPVQSTHVSRDAVYFEVRPKLLYKRSFSRMCVGLNNTAIVPPQTNVARESITIVYLFNELPGGRVQFSMESSVLPVGVIPTW